jgi:hypothetical protein
VIDVSHGHLEQALRIEDELGKLRYSYLKTEGRGLWARLAAYVVIAIGAIPAVYAILPEDSRRLIWVTVVVAVSLGYVLLLILQLVSQHSASKQLDKLLPDEADSPLESRVYFIDTQISSGVTRLWAAANVLAASPAEPIRQRFEQIKGYWEKRLDHLKAEIDSLRESDELSETDYKALKSELESGRNPKVFDEPKQR